MASCRIVVMGVCGSGKSTVGRLLAGALGGEFVEGDVLHSVENKRKMAAGSALTDADRHTWLHALAQRLATATANGQDLVMACSALKRAYRDLLAAGAPDALFVHLHGDRTLLARRLQTRTGHFMSPSLLESQLAILEPPGKDENALFFDCSTSPDAIVSAVIAQQRPCGRPKRLP